jgi:hypothetical protein
MKLGVSLAQGYTLYLKFRPKDTELQKDDTTYLLWQKAYSN